MAEAEAEAERGKTKFFSIPGDYFLYVFFFCCWFNFLLVRLSYFIVLFSRLASEILSMRTRLHVWRGRDGAVPRKSEGSRLQISFLRWRCLSPRVRGTHTKRKKKPRVCPCGRMDVSALSAVSITLVPAPLQLLRKAGPSPRSLWVRVGVGVGNVGRNRTGALNCHTTAVVGFLVERPRADIRRPFAGKNRLEHRHHLGEVRPLLCVCACVCCC